MDPLWVCGGVALCLLLAWAVGRESLLIPTGSAFPVLFSIWVGGLALALLMNERLPSRQRYAVLFAGSAWGGAGAVALAVIIPSEVRLALLAGPFVVLLYAAAYLARMHMLVLLLGCALAYGLALTVLAMVTEPAWGFELISAVYFALLLGAVLLLSDTMYQMRDSLLERNRGLREAMERLQDLALRDELTALSNRRSILEVLQRQRAVAQREQGQFTVCYCDLDHFKQINDRYGHVVGDAALREFAKCAQSVVRNVDYVARFGGEEFLLVLPGAGEEIARRVCERLASRTRKLWVPGTDDEFRLTVSVGVASYQPTDSVDDILNRADRALYSAKTQGRDRVVLAT